MFPIRDHNPSEKVPYVTWSLIAINVAIFLYMWPLFAQPYAINAFFYDWALIPARLSTGQGGHTLVTSMFLHAGLLHLAGNMLFLWIFGDNLEEELGHWRFLGFYLLGGLGAALVHLVSNPLSPVPTIGASGAIAAVMGGYFLLFPRARVDVLLFLIVFVRIFAVPAWVMLGVWFALQITASVTIDSSQGGVAYWAHSGGFAAGLLMLLPLWLARGGPAFWRRTDGHPPHPEARYRIRQTTIPKVPRRRD